MENCFQLLPRKSYNTFGLVLLTFFVTFGVVVIGIAGAFDVKATLQCNPDKTLASDSSTRKYIETQCSLKYAKEFNHFFPLHVLFVINFGIVLFFSFLYAYSVKHRVQCFADPPSSTTVNTNDAEDPSLLPPPGSQAALDPVAHQNSERYVVFIFYIMHLIIGRIVPMVVFAALLLNSSNYPIKFQCPYPSPIQTKSTFYTNLTQKQATNVSAVPVDCTNPLGESNDGLAVSVTIVNFAYGTITFIEVAYLLWSAWKDNNLFTDMEFCCVYILRKRKRIRKLMKKIREKISEEMFYLHDDFGEKRLSRRKLTDIYINVIIQDGRESTWTSRRQYKNRHETYEAQFKAPLGAAILDKTSDIFKYTSVKQKHPRTILVVGRPGIGKSLLTKIIFYEWQQQALEFWHDKIVLLLRFRAFNNKKTSLREMLRHADGFNMSSNDFTHIYEYICLKPGNVVLVFDGLDELKVDDESLTEEKTVNSHNEVTHILLIFKQLVKGELLHGATVLVSSRPTAEQIYKRLQFDREVEILGFHEDQIKNYVEKFCRDDLHKSIKIWDFIKESPELLSLCYVPVNSYIVCLTLSETISNSLEEIDYNVPRTITELYKRATKILLFKHNVKYKGKEIPKDYIVTKLPESLQNDLNKLKEIAKNGMLQDQLIFEFQNNDEFVTELSDCGLFNKLDDKRQNVFSFLHLTIQEFLAAQHVVDDMKNVELFLSENINNPRWHLVIQFVAGLIGDKIRELNTDRNISEMSKENESIINRIRKRFKDWIPNTRRIDGKDNTLLVIKCAHEMQDVDAMTLIASSLCEDGGEKCEELYLGYLNIAPVESTALFKFLCHVDNLYKLKIENCVMEDFGFCELGKLLSKVKENEITDLHITNVSITENGAIHVFDALKHENCKLTELNISFNQLTQVDAIKHLGGALKSDNSKLTKLNVSHNELTYVSVIHLSGALTSNNCKLTELTISHNKLIDVSAEYLRDALRSDNCKLTKLNISHNELKNGGVKYLSYALKSNNCKLTELKISYNKLTDDSAKYLRDSLKSSNCKLTKLSMGGNELTDVSAEYLSEALMSNDCKLTELNMSHNELTDEGATYLSDALKSDKCKLTKLNMSYNKLTDMGAKYLKDATTSRTTNVTLDIIM